MEISAFRESLTVITNPRSNSLKPCKRSASSGKLKLPPLKKGNFRDKSIDDDTQKILDKINSDSLIRPKQDLKNLFSILNDYDARNCKLSPTTYLTDFEQNLREDCKQKYDKIMKELNEVRSMKNINTYIYMKNVYLI